jgi:hypothetical protein
MLLGRHTVAGNEGKPLPLAERYFYAFDCIETSGNTSAVKRQLTERKRPTRRQRAGHYCLFHHVTAPSG